VGKQSRLKLTASTLKFTASTPAEKVVKSRCLVALLACCSSLLHCGCEFVWTSHTGCRDMLLCLAGAMAKQLFAGRLVAVT
jgi:hypothetical protein